MYATLLMALSSVTTRILLDARRRLRTFCLANWFARNNKRSMTSKQAQFKSIAAADEASFRRLHAEHTGGEYSRMNKLKKRRFTQISQVFIVLYTVSFNSLSTHISTLSANGLRDEVAMLGLVAIARVLGCWLSCYLTPTRFVSVSCRPLRRPYFPFI